MVESVGMPDAPVVTVILVTMRGKRAFKHTSSLTKTQSFPYFTSDLGCKIRKWMVFCAFFSNSVDVVFSCRGVRVNHSRSLCASFLRVMKKEKTTNRGGGYVRRKYNEKCFIAEAKVILWH